MISEKRTAKAASGSARAYFEGGKYVYLKELHLLTSDLGKYIALEFEGVYGHCQIFINDVNVYHNDNGFMPFVFQIDQFLDFGSSNKNLIKVIVDNTEQPNNRWYSGSGIYRSVYLYKGNKNHILINGMQVKTLSAFPAIVNFKIDATI